ncbi:MAG: FecR domain-containing protein [Bdellovibrionia bacterium]
MRHVLRSIPSFLTTISLMASPFCLSTSSWATDANESAPAGDIVSVSGTVLLRSDAQQAKMRTAKAGDVIYIKDVINTGSDGRIKVLMKDKSIIDLGPSALFKIDDFKGKKGAADREVDVSMVYGTMRAAVTQKLEGKGKFKVKTPSATMGVRGTEFVVKSEVSDLKDVGKLLKNTSGTLPPAALASQEPNLKSSTEVTVLQGKVDVGKHDFNASAMTAGRNPSSAGIVSLTAGNQISTALGSAAITAPKMMDAGQMKTIATEAKVVDTTFQKAVIVENSNQGGQGSRSPASSGGPGLAPSPDGIHRVLASTEVPLPPPPPVRPIDLNIPGALGPNQIFNQPAINTQGSLKKLRVVITTN